MPQQPPFALVSHKVFAKHDTRDLHPALEAFESPARVAQTLHFLREETPALWQQCSVITPAPASKERLALVHPPVQVEHVARMQEYGLGEVGNNVNASPQVFEVACLAAGAAIDASLAVYNGKYSSAFCLSRPPGHHATPYTSEGLCVFNNLAVAAQVLLHETSANRIAIIDFDAHYGDGIASIFYEDPRVLYLSSHEMIFDQGERGLAEECGAGKGKGHNVCFPLPFGSTDECLEVVANQFAQILAQYKPQIILVAAGFDGHYADPVGNLAFTTRGYFEFGSKIRSVAADTCQGKVVAALEGGYNLLAVPWCIAAFLQGILGQTYASTWTEFPVTAEPGVLARFEEERVIFQKTLGKYWTLI